MGWDGAGNIDLLYDWTNDRDAGAPDHFIDAEKMDLMFADIATAIEATLNRNGENDMLADLDMGSNRITDLGAATAQNDAPRVRQITENTLQYGGTTGGSGNAYTLTKSTIETVATGTPFFSRRTTQTAARQR